tara:strand:+ start:75 stop:548 length:474 start_codon:yes stop_codon:yes gene_type:complete
MQTQMQVATTDEIICIKVQGPANFSLAVDFKSVVSRCCEEGGKGLLLDLSGCPNMDSTFLGIIVGLTGRLERIELLNPQDRVTDLLENLGVLDLVAVGQGSNPFLGRLKDAGSVNADKRELAQTSLEAHRILMDLNPENVPRFKDVAKFLKEDLGRQ